MTDKDKEHPSHLGKSPAIRQIRASLNAGSSRTFKKVTKSVHGLRNMFQKDASSELMPTEAAKPPSPVYQLPSGRPTSPSREPLLSGGDGSASSTVNFTSSQATSSQAEEVEAARVLGEANVGEFFERFQEAIQLAREKDTDKCHDKCRKLLQMRISDGLRYEVLKLMTTILPSREALVCVEEMRKLSRVMDNNANHMRRRIREQGAVWDG